MDRSEQLGRTEGRSTVDISISANDARDARVTYSLRHTICLTIGYAASIVGNNEVRSLGLSPNVDKSLLQPEATLLTMASMVELVQSG